MDFEWDEDKRITNIAKHGIDFVGAAHILFGNSHLKVPTKTVAGSSAG